MKVQSYFSLIQTVVAGFFLFCLAYTWAGSSSQAVSCERVISNINELAAAVTEKAEFSNSENHIRLFELYRLHFLGKRDTEKTLEGVMNLVEEYPELSKPALREQILTLEEKHYEPSQRLREVVKRLKDSADQFQASFFQQEANIGFWQKLLMPLKKSDLEGLSAQEKKAKKKEHKAQFREYFDQVLTPEDREILEYDFLNDIEKTIAVYRILERIHAQMTEEGRDVQALSQAMVDLVHTSGFKSLHYINQLKNQNTLNQIKGLKNILEERNTVAEQLGFEGQFSELINSLNVDHPTGSTKNENLFQILSDIQRDVQNSSYTVESRQVFRVRALSLQESPFRGCLGNDCSTDQYFDLALDPNFLYFTLTNEEIQSSGHITVVLGKAYSKKKKRLIKIAFVDKIQEVPQAVILPMLEAVRLSLEELGYRLGLPVGVGSRTGLSDTDMIRDYMDSEVNPFFTHQLEGFKPHKNQYGFDKGYSRAYSKPEILEFERWESDGFKIEEGEIYTGSKIPEELKMADLYQDVLSLKDSEKEENQIQFMNHLRSSIKIEGLDLSIAFVKDYLNSKIKDKQVSFKLRKKALYTLFGLWTETNKAMINRDEILSLLENFSLEEKTEILGEMGNWKNSNENYRLQFIDIFSWNIIDNSLIKDVFNSPLRQIFNINALNGDGETILFSAVREGQRSRVKFLLDHGADIHAVNIYEETVLFLAVRWGQRIIAKMLLDHGAEINVINIKGETVLFPAVSLSDQVMAKMLLDHGVKINARNIEERTVLNTAVNLNDLPMIQFLLDHGADPNMRFDNGETVLSVARKRGNQSMVQLFSDHKGNTQNRYLYLRLRVRMIQFWSRFYVQ